jgi:hypothetical protein
MSKDIDFNDTIFVLGCGCTLVGCSGAAGVDKFKQGRGLTAHCFTHFRRTMIVDIVTVGTVGP